MPRVTVIIPTYNWSAVLPYSIGSVLRQTFADWELLVVGDGCTDDSEAVVERTAQGDPRIRWVNLPANTGQQSGPNNEGLRLAAGELVAYLGHDDLWLPHHLATLVPAIEGGAGLAYGMVEAIAPDGAPPTHLPHALGRYVPGEWIPPTGVVHRRDAARAVGGWRHRDDVDRDPEADLWRRLHRAGERFAFVPRLTAVKFPAAWRRGVYRERPSHEQALWFERTARDPDFEAVELARILAGHFERPRLSIARRQVHLIRDAYFKLRTRLLGYRRTTFADRRALKGLPPLR